MSNVFEKYDLPEEMETLTQKEMAELVGVSVRTLIRWDKDRMLIARRRPNGQPFYIRQDYLDYLSQSKKRGEEYNV